MNMIFWNVDQLTNVDYKPIYMHNKVIVYQIIDHTTQY